MFRLRLSNALPKFKVYLSFEDISFYTSVFTLNEHLHKPNILIFIIYQLLYQYVFIILCIYF